MLEQAREYVTGQAFKSIILLIARFGMDGFKSILNRRLAQLYAGSGTQAIFGQISLHQRLALLVDQEGITESDLKLGKLGNCYFIK